jgi:type II secretory pathway predicted ATPase ExeA
MYELFYGFREKPFSILPDPDFLFLSQKHRLALSMLEYGLTNQTSFTVITGEIGSGKTILVRKLLQEIDENITVGLVSNTQCSSFEELFRWILFAFELEYRGKDKVELYHTFTDFLIKEYGFNRRVVLIIDEAQNLGPEALEQLRMLSNVNAYKHHVLQLVLIGQPNLRNLLRHPELEQFAQRVGVDYHLKPLNSQETVSYIHHRLKVAGGNTSLFTEDACLLIWRYSKGIPRLINILCDMALVYGFAEQDSKIEVTIIEEVAHDKQMVLPLGEEKQKYEKKPIIYRSDDNLDNMDSLPFDSTITQENKHHKENQHSFIKQNEHDQDKATTIERLQLKLKP